MIWNGNKCKKKLMRISRKKFPLKLMIGQKTTEESGLF
jgi:hypothetical protein